MIKESFLAQLNKEDLNLELIPELDLEPWRLSYYHNKFDYHSIERQVITNIKIKVVLTSDSDIMKEIGQILVSVINAHYYDDETMWSVDGEDGELFEALEALDYSNHESNYLNYGFDYPYQPFIVVKAIYLEKEYRNFGIGSTTYEYLNDLVNSFLNLNTNLLIWTAFPFATDTKVPTAEDFKMVHNFALKCQGEEIETFEDRKYYIRINEP